MLYKEDKKYLTRYIYLNQPCSLSNLISEFCIDENSIIRLDLNEVVEYIVKIYNDNYIVFKPPLEEIEDDLSKSCLNNLLKKDIDIQLVIPNYISKVWKNWYIKEYLKDK